MKNTSHDGTLIKQVVKTKTDSPKVWYSFKFGKHIFSAHCMPRVREDYSQRSHSLMGNKQTELKYNTYYISYNKILLGAWRRDEF